MFRNVFLSIFLFSSLTVFGQAETLSNGTIIEMSRAGLSVDVIFKKISSSRPGFDVSAQGLIELKKAGVDDGVIALMMERADSSPPQLRKVSKVSDGAIVTAAPDTELPYSESSPTGTITGEKALATAKTIAFGKSSLQPSRQALEKELLKRQDFRQLGLTILRYKEQADLFVDIGFVSGSWVSHRYVYRIYDRRSGAVITAGETTSWGSLAENLARHIAKRLTVARLAKQT